MRIVRTFRLAVAATVLLTIARAQTPVSPQSKPQAGVMLDRVIAIVNGALVLDSDLDEEQRFQALQTTDTVAAKETRAERLNRLIDRVLIVQQARAQALPLVSDVDLDAELLQLRSTLPGCKAAHCETDAGWTEKLKGAGFTPASFRERWRERMTVLAFVDQRFKNSVSIPPADVENYYKTVMLPQYAEKHQSPPPLGNVAPRIEEILLSQSVNKLLDDWLTALRAQGQVVILKEGEPAP